jgi:membrane associated rhomboid family serine protease
LHSLIKRNFKQIFIFIFLIWVSFAITTFLPFIKNYGIVPRTISGLIGIVTSPFLHGNLLHIISNTIALITFAPIFYLIEKEDALENLIFLTLLTGILTWLVGRNASHIGASGVIFALYGYLISLGFFYKKILYMGITFFLLTSYGYILFGLLPIIPGVSWEGHLMGFVAGIISAKLNIKN